MFENCLGAQYTLYSFDLFAHGQSVWGHGDSALSPKVWSEMIEEFLEQEQINEFSIMAYSMGGKMALTAYEYFSKRVKKLILIAPDGIKTSFWYSAATYPGILSKFFKFTVYNPSYYFKILKVFKFFKLIDQGILKFADNEMNSPSKRERVYFSWMIHRNIIPSKEIIVEKLNASSTEIIFVTGRYDKIMQSKDIATFADKIKNAKHYVLDSGHTSLLKNLAKEENIKFINYV